MFGPFMAGGFGHCNVTHQSFGSEAGDFWHGGSFGHCGPSRPQTDKQTNRQTDKQTDKKGRMSTI